jgi:hypothetical protein
MYRQRQRLFVNPGSVPVALQCDQNGLLLPVQQQQQQPAASCEPLSEYPGCRADRPTTAAGL